MHLSRFRPLLPDAHRLSGALGLPLRGVCLAFICQAPLAGQACQPPARAGVPAPRAGQACQPPSRARRASPPRTGVPAPRAGQPCQPPARARRASPPRGVPGIHLPSSRQGAGSPSAPVSMGVVPAAVPPASARNAEAWLTCHARSAMVGDRVEGCSRRGRGIKLPGLRPCVGPPRDP